MTAKKALITGASEGLGRAFAKELAAMGYETTLVARNEPRLQELVTQLNSLTASGKHQYRVSDLANAVDIKALAEHLQETDYDLLINNAGFSQFGDFAQSERAIQQSILTVNCEALLVLAHAFLASAKQGDALINLSSLTNILPTPVQPVYVASKTFIAALSESLWYQQRKKGVYVQGLCPGVTKTKFMERASNIDGFKERLVNSVAQTPEQVVGCALRALEKRKGPLIIPGLGNRLLALFLTFLPRKPLILGMGKLSDLADNAHQEGVRE